MFIEFFIWWYGKGWQEAGKSSLALIKSVQLEFSIPVLLKTLFAPWRRIITVPGSSFDEKMRSYLDNLVSRMVGFFMRLFALLAAFILTILTGGIGLIMTLLWPLIPVLIVYCAYRGIVG